MVLVLLLAEMMGFVLLLKLLAIVLHLLVVTAELHVLGIEYIVFLIKLAIIIGQSFIL